MNTTLDQIVNAVLYEGYILYPYRHSSKKNSRERFTFGRVYPQVYSAAQKGAEPSRIQTECLLRANGEGAQVRVTARFLQPAWREVCAMQNPGDFGLALKRVSELAVDGRILRTRQEAIERTVSVAAISPAADRGTERQRNFKFAEESLVEPVHDAHGSLAGSLLRRNEAVRGRIEIHATPLADGVFKITVRISNRSELPPEMLSDNAAVLMRTFASTHTILQATGGEFVSLMDPPTDLREMADACHNTGTWPVLVGDEKLNQRDTLLSSPIILYDYPQIAPESGGDFFDGTEMDEMLALRVMTLTDEEKREMCDADPFARRILERTESLPPENLRKLHGTLRDAGSPEDFFNPQRRVHSVAVGGVTVHAGTRVRLHPKGRADAFDLFLDGKIAIVEAVEEDAESRIHFAVVLEDDPGKDLGLLRQPGHRFFYGADEIEPLKEIA